MTNFPIINQRLYKGTKIVDRANEPHTIIGRNADGWIVTEDRYGQLNKHKNIIFNDCHLPARIFYITRDGNGDCTIWDDEPELKFDEYVVRHPCKIRGLELSLAEYIVGRKINYGECIKFVEEVSND